MRGSRFLMPVLFSFLLSGCVIGSLEWDGNQVTKPIYIVEPVDESYTPYEEGTISTGGHSRQFGGGGVSTGGISLTEQGYRVGDGNKGNPIIEPYCLSESYCANNNVRENKHSKRQQNNFIRPMYKGSGGKKR